MPCWRNGNVTWEGEIPAVEVPARLAGAAAGITPYADTEFNRSSFPLKTLDYLSAGLPVVSTDLPAARSLGTGHVAREATPADFTRALRKVLADTPDPRQIRERQRFARGAFMGCPRTHPAGRRRGCLTGLDG